MLSQKFVLVPQGYIKDATASYTADEVTGDVSAQEDIDAVIMFIPYELKGGPTSAKVDPKMFLSASIVKGLKFVVGPVSAQVTSVKPGVSANVAIQVKSDTGSQTVDANGNITLNLKNKFWSIDYILATAVIGNIPFIGSITQIIEAKPA
jgi:hypothetical protein